jgi:hypothetical protein
LASDTARPSARSHRPAGADSQRANAAKLSDTSSTPRSPSSWIARTTTNSIRPFGVSRSRRMNDSDIAGRP